MDLIGRSFALMIRDTFEANPGLCELFKRKMLERARFVGLGEDLIDFETQIDMKGTYQDNLRIIYRQHPQLSQNSDYFRIKSIRPLSGAALEQSWRSYEQDNGHETPQQTREAREEPARAEVADATMPELIITYTIGSESVLAQNGTSEEPEPISIKPKPRQVEANLASSTYRELAKSIIDSLTTMAGEKVTKVILHQLGEEIGRTAFNYSEDQILSDNLVDALDHVLSIRGWGRVLDLDEIDHGSHVTYVCTIEGCSLCFRRVATNPTCDITRGIVTGWLESLVERKAESSIETACIATGSQLCVFRVTFKK